MGNKTNTEKLDLLLERTVVLEQVAKTVEEHECILRGQNRDDGLITEFAMLKQNWVKAEQRFNKIIAALGTPFVLSIVAFVWGLLTHSISITFGK